jgi:CPA2 family monovalent cation:H+ antiporter-2
VNTALKGRNYGRTHISLFSLMIVITLAFLIPIILDRLNWKFIPIVVVEILAGLILGKSGFGVIYNDEWLALFSTTPFGLRKKLMM